MTVTPLTTRVDEPRVTIQTEAPTESLIESLYRTYYQSWNGLRDKSPCRQYLNREEFFAEMHDPRVLKFFLWGEEGEVLALALVATDLSIIPWAAPDFFAARFPEHYRENRIFYIGSVVVRRNRRGGLGYVDLLLKAITLHMADHRGIAAFDCSEHMLQLGWPERIAAAGHRHSVMREVPLGTQAYYAYVVDGHLPEDPEPTTRPLADAA